MLAADRLEDEWIVDDVYLLAAILTFAPETPYRLWSSEQGRVVFRVWDDLAEPFRRLDAGEEVPLDAYINKLKTLRSEVFAFKSGPKRGRCEAGDWNKLAGK